MRVWESIVFERGLILIKGVNRQVVEITETGCEYFEKVLFFIKPEFSAVSEGDLKERATIIAQGAGIPPATRLKKNKIRFAVDVFTNYSSDVNVSVKAGHNLRHACIGPGVYASHGYERSHKLGVEATFELIRAYLG